MVTLIIASPYSVASITSSGKKSPFGNFTPCQLATRPTIYLHPDTSPDPRKPYLKSYDIYSLGVVITELAFWLPIEDVLEKYDLIQYRNDNLDFDGKQLPQQHVRVGSIFKMSIARAGAPADIEDGEVEAPASRSDLSRWCGNGQDISVGDSLLHYEAH